MSNCEATSAKVIPFITISYPVTVQTSKCKVHNKRIKDKSKKKLEKDKKKTSRLLSDFVVI